MSPAAVPALSLPPARDAVVASNNLSTYRQF